MNVEELKSVIPYQCFVRVTIPYWSIKDRQLTVMAIFDA